MVALTQIYLIRLVDSLLLQVTLVLLAAIGGFVVYVYSTYKPTPPKVEAEAPLSRRAAKLAAKAAGAKRA